MAGKLLVVPPRSRRGNAVSALLVSSMIESAGLSIDERPFQVNRLVTGMLTIPPVVIELARFITPVELTVKRETPPLTRKSINSPPNPDGALSPNSVPPVLQVVGAAP